MTESARVYLVNLALFLWLGVCLTLNFPGHLSLDSLVQIAEGRSGIFESWNPVFISVVFGRLSAAANTTGVLVLMSALVLGWSLRTLILSVSRGSVLGLLMMAGLLSAPILLIYPGIVWKDVWFAHAAFAGFALMTTLPQAPPGRALLIRSLILAFFAFAMLSRQTGVLVAAVGVLALAAGSPWIMLRARWRTFLVSALLNAVVLLLIQTAFSAAADSVVVKKAGAPVQTGLRLIATYDLAGVLARVPGARLDRFSAAGVDTDPMREAAANTYRADRIDTLQWPYSPAYVNLPANTLYRQWLDTILAHPVAYLGHRFEVFGWLLGVRDQGKCAPVHVGFEKGALTEAAGIDESQARNSAALYIYTMRWVGSPYFSPLFWALISACVLIYLRWRNMAFHPVAWMQWAGLLYLLSYIPVSIACDFRYTYFTTLMGHAGLLFVSLHIGAAPPSGQPVRSEF